MSSIKIVLPDSIVSIIQEVVETVRQQNGINSELVKDSIFGILESHCTVIYYPLTNEKNRGFHIKKLVNDSLEDFVYINTDKTVEQQVFTAAHELGHIFKVYDKVCNMALQRDITLDRMDQDYEEKVTDRFAAELLMPEDIFRKATIDYSTELNMKNDVSLLQILKLIAKLMDSFMSPFNAVRKRLYEIRVIDDKADNYMSDRKVLLEKMIDCMKRDDNRLISSKTDVKTISGLRELLESAVKNDSVDRSLIQKIRADFGIEELEVPDNLTINLFGAES